MRTDEFAVSQLKKVSEEKKNRKPVSSFFGEYTFNKGVMQSKLPRSIYLKLMSCIEENTKLDIDTANAVAHAMKEWAMDNGATHFAHWFQPMTGATAEKHDAFIEFSGTHEVIERFSGSQLVQSEPDASSFPSGGIRATFEARGYTAWDMSSPAFIRKNGHGITLCIPSAYISYTGEALDKKTPLLRSVRAVDKSSIRMLRLLGNDHSKKVVSNLGPEQEYFLIDRSFYIKRQDLILTGRTLLGAAPAKGQELEDQYFGSIQERIQSFMHDFDEELFRLGIPAKTRHNEVAPSQFEIAPIFEEANLAVDHNQLLMDTMTKVARRHNLAALLHEKPFAGVNGSGKHVNWSIGTDDGINLLNPGKTPTENIQFLVFLIAVIKAVHRHGDILRATVATTGNEHRLGANEAPPAIISVFLGEQLERILGAIEKGEILKDTDAALIDLGLASLPVVSKDNTDRNRTSPFAFTGNKFEFRAVGSSQSISLAAAVINMIVAESLDELADKIEKAGKGDLKKIIIDLIQSEIKEVKSVVFGGDNYSAEWHKEAARRGLPNYRTTPESLKSFNTDKAKQLFEKYKVLSNVELYSRYHIHLENYIKKIEIEARTFFTIVTSQVIPAAIRYQNDIAGSIKNTAGLVDDSILKPQKDLLVRVSTLIGKIQDGMNEQKCSCDAAKKIEHEQEKAEYYCNKVKVKMDELRVQVDELETIMDDLLWPLPKFWEMLFIC
ncbi:MAG TPA: glutamine synthetase III [Spirochaetota bacterium]|nr:glutamine synthetase III [Spirochaetota bacterium]HPS86124.1 glutamine synthetase III [Spirochaetota bacterium]